MYAVNGVSAFFVYSVGPATPLIADDLSVSAQAASLHGTAMAAALLTSGAVATPALRRYGRAGTIGRCMLVMALGVLLILAAPVLAVSLVGAFLAGCSGSVAAISANATLAEVHPEVAPTVLTEANAAAAWVGLFAPLLMGAFLTVGAGWRWGLALAVPLCLVMVPVTRSALRSAGVDEPAGQARERAERAAAPAGAPSQAPLRAPVPPILWVVMLAVAAAAGVEFAVNYWGATLLAQNTGAPAGTITAAMSAPVAGVAVGRTLGARLALRVPAHPLLIGGWALALLGFAGFWRAGSVPLAFVGMFVTGLGLSVLYPLLLDRAVLLLPQNPDRALALAMPFVGVAIGVAPFGLGAVAGVVGVGTAFLVVPLLMAMGLGAVLLSRPAPSD